MINWFKRRKDEDEFDELEDFEVYSSEVPLTNLLRWFINDTGQNKFKVDELLGLPPISDEGAEKEAQDSVLRLNEIQPMVPFMDFISDAASMVFSTVGSSLAESMDEDEREEMEEVLESLYKSIALNAVIGAFSIANALGMIHITAFSSEVGMNGDMYDEQRRLVGKEVR